MAYFDSVLLLLSEGFAVQEESSHVLGDARQQEWSLPTVSQE